VYTQDTTDDWRAAAARTTELHELYGLRAMQSARLAWTMRLQGTPAMLDRTRAIWLQWFVLRDGAVSERVHEAGLAVQISRIIKHCLTCRCVLCFSYTIYAFGLFYVVRLRRNKCIPYRMTAGRVWEKENRRFSCLSHAQKPLTGYK